MQRRAPLAAGRFPRHRNFALFAGRKLRQKGIAGRLKRRNARRKEESRRRRRRGGPTAPKSQSGLPRGPSSVFGAVTFFSSAVGCESTSFGGDAYTYIYRGIVASAMTLHRICQAVGMSMMCGGVAIACAFVAKIR